MKIFRLFAAFPLICFVLSQAAYSVVPAPDGGYPNGNTAEGEDALFSLTTGGFNTAVGYFSLRSDTTGNFNTGVGAGTLLANTGGENTATGAGALLSNSTGAGNTANGAFALRSNTTGSFNTASGYHALLANTGGNFNTANGHQALASNTSGTGNTANGVNALVFNTTGDHNAAHGDSALYSNRTGFENTATGFQALFSNQTGIRNTAIGAHALQNNSTGDGNTALGLGAGFNITGNNNVCIGLGVVGQAGVNSTTWIRNVYGSGASARQVYVNSDDKVGTLASSRRFKEEIKPMDKASEVLFALKPVSFRYKKEFDAGRAPMFGLIAEDVEQVDPDLVSRNEKGEVETVRYEQINAMLLNEFLKEHRKNEEQEATILRQQKQIEALTAGLQKVSAQLEVSKAKPQVAENNQ
jgi:hypothetical protein